MRVLCFFIAAAAFATSTAHAANRAIVTASLNNHGLCSVRPSRAAANIYNAMTSARASGGLNDAELLDHASRRLGYGLSPLGPLRPIQANDCSTVFVAETLTEQIAQLGTRADNSAFTRVRQGILPLTAFRRTLINQEVHAQLMDPAGVALNSAAVLNGESRMQIMRLKLLRELLGSQTVTSGVVFDEQVNFEQVWHELWLNHFNVEIAKANQYVYGSDGYAETMRTQIGGTFEALLIAAIRHPAMLNYLDQAFAGCSPQSGPAANQNLGRELLELHTLGVSPTAGVYAQADVEAVSRALCGWNARVYREPLAVGDTGFLFNAAKAATGAVQILGVNYTSTGEARMTAVLRALARHARTKTNVCTKIAAQLYAAPLRTGARDACVAAWGTGGDLKRMASTMLTRAPFWSRQNQGALLRNPLEQVNAVARAAGVNLADYHDAVVARGLVASTFNPATLTPQLTVDRVNAHQVEITHDSFRMLSVQGDVMGLLRGRIVPPTGYPQDGAAFLSPAVIDEGSRSPYIVAAALDRLAAPARRDRVSPAFDANITNQLSSNTGSTVLSWHVRDVLGYGPLSLHTPSQRTIAVNVVNAPAAWASTSGAPQTKRAATTLLAVSAATNRCWER